MRVLVLIGLVVIGLSQTIGCAGPLPTHRAAAVRLALISCKGHPEDSYESHSCKVNTIDMWLRGDAHLDDPIDRETWETCLDEMRHDHMATCWAVFK